MSYPSFRSCSHGSVRHCPDYHIDSVDHVGYLRRLVGHDGSEEWHIHAPVAARANLPAMSEEHESDGLASGEALEGLVHLPVVADGHRHHLGLAAHLEASDNSSRQEPGESLGAVHRTDEH